MLNLLAQGAGTFGVLLVALPWILLFFLPVAMVAAIPFYLFYKDREFGKIKARLKVLIVDDDESSVLSLVSILSGKAADICIAENADSMLKELRENKFDILFVDRLMPKQNGDIALAIADQQSQTDGVPVIFFTGNNDGLIIPKLNHFKIVGVWDKLVGYQALEAKVARMLDTLQTTAEVA